MLFSRRTNSLLRTEYQIDNEQVYSELATGYRADLYSDSYIYCITEKMSFQQAIFEFQMSECASMHGQLIL